MRQTKRIVLTAVLILTALLSLPAASYLYARFIHDTLQTETNSYMKELAAQSIRLIQERVNNDYLYLEGISDSIGARNNPINAPSILYILQEKSETTRFSSLSVADPEGNVYSLALQEQGRALNVAHREYFKRAMAGEPYVEGLTDDEEANIPRSLIISYPIFRDGAVIGATIGQYSMNELDNLLAIAYFDGAGYNYIIRTNGEMLASSQDLPPTATLDSLISQRGSVTDLNASSILDHMTEGKSGSLYFKKAGQEHILSYTPVGISDWYLLVVVPTQVVDAKASYIIRGTVFYCTFALLILGVIVLYYFRLKKKSHQQLTQAYQRIQSIYRTVPNAVVQFSIDGSCTIRNANDAFYHLLGCSREDYQNKCSNSLLPIIHPDDRAAILALREGLTSLEFRVLTYSGKTIWVYGNFDIQSEEGHYLAQCAFLDISLQKQQISEAEQKARVDALTGLNNRLAIDYEKNRLLAATGSGGALFACDLDRFKAVNDTLGHAAGDALLRQFADCLKASFRKDDFIARTGGDEFIVYLKNIPDADQAERKALRLMETVEKAFAGYARDFGLSLSLGIALFPSDGTSFDELMERADEALYHAKSHGKQQYCFYRDIMKNQ